MNNMLRVSSHKSIHDVTFEGNARINQILHGLNSYWFMKSILSDSSLKEWNIFTVPQANGGEGKFAFKLSMRGDVITLRQVFSGLKPTLLFLCSILLLFTLR